MQLATRNIRRFASKVSSDRFRYCFYSKYDSIIHLLFAMSSNWYPDADAIQLSSFFDLDGLQWDVQESENPVLIVIAFGHDLPIIRFEW